MQYSDILNELRREIGSVQNDLAANLDVIATAAGDDPAFMAAVEAYADQMERIGAAAGAIGLGGLQDFCRYINDVLLSATSLVQYEREMMRSAIGTWPKLVLEYLDATEDFAAAEKLVSLFSAAGSPLPIAEDLQMEMMTRLLSPPDTSQFMEDASGPSYAEPTLEDISLTIPADVDPGLFEAFMHEAPAHATEFSGLIHKLAGGGAATADIAQAKRIAHTLKGSASIIGIRGITVLAHHVEDILEHIERHPQALPAQLSDALMDAAGCIEGMVYTLLGVEEPPASAISILQTVLHWAEQISLGEIGETAGESPQIVAQEQMVVPRVRGETEPAGEKENQPKREAASAVARDLRISVNVVDDLFRLVGEMSIKAGQLQDRLRLASQRAKSLLEQDRVVQQRIFELENLVDVRGLASMRSMRRQGVLNDAGFDPLEFDQYNELHSATRGLIEGTVDARELGLGIEEDIAQLSTILVRQEQMNSEIRHLAMSMRMTPIKNIVSRLVRNVRQTCQMTSKNAELVIEGADILVDGEVLNKLADPLLHVLRNAVDHGIESPDARVAAGKPGIGTIRLSFARQGQTVVVRCIDDGRGLDFTAIHQKAMRLGFISLNQVVTETELARMVLLPGFSTRDQVSEISGRGVGMDVVRDSVLAMKGSVDIRSEFGKGCTVELRFQASLASMHSLLVEAADETFAIPSHNVVQGLAPGLGEFVEMGGVISFHYGRNVHAIHPLSTLLGMRVNQRPAPDTYAKKSIVMVRGDDGIVAVLVDRIIDARDLFIKGMGKYVRQVRGVSGASMLGDGTVVPFIDIPELLRQPVRGVATGADRDDAPSSSFSKPLSVLIVDDSLSVRKSLSQLIGDAGYQATTANDGLEAADAIRSCKPDVLITDLEMPNMNGLELAAHVRSDAQTRNLPIIMVTSRYTDKHREQAKLAGVDVFLTKPYSEIELLGHVRKASAAQA